MVSHLGWESLAVRRSNMRLHTMYRKVHTTMGDPWHRWLTLSTRQTRGFHPWRYIPLSPSNDPYKFLLTLHYTSLEQPPTPCCLLSNTRLLPPTTKYYVNHRVFFNSPLFSMHNFCFAVPSCFLFRLQLALFNTSFRHVICAHTQRRAMLQERSERCSHKEEEEIVNKDL